MGLFDAILGPVSEIVGKIVPDKDLRNQLIAELNMKMASIMEAELQARSSIILAEAKGESWLQRNWRPLMMVFFAGLIGAHWFGFTPENLTENQIADLYDLVTLGLGGYVLGRSAEKIAPTVADAFAKRK